LKKIYLERAKDDLAIAQEWEPIEKELWEKEDREFDLSENSPILYAKLIC